MDNSPSSKRILSVLDGIGTWYHPSQDRLLNSSTNELAVSGWQTDFQVAKDPPPFGTYGINA